MLGGERQHSAIRIAQEDQRVFLVLKREGERLIVGTGDGNRCLLGILTDVELNIGGQRELLGGPIEDRKKRLQIRRELGRRFGRRDVSEDKDKRDQEEKATCHNDPPTRNS